MKDRLISGLLLLIVGFKCLDLYIDFAEEVDTFHLVQEFILIALSLSVFLYLINDIRLRSNAAKLLASQLREAQRKTSEMSEQLRKSQQSFFSAIQEQFDIWSLTPSEKDVALFLLKGLSLAEISELRNTSEKTIRHQASAVYKKAQCSGRHELAAFFFEEFN